VDQFQELKDLIEATVRLFGEMITSNQETQAKTQVQTTQANTQVQTLPTCSPEEQMEQLREEVRGLQRLMEEQNERNKAFLEKAKANLERLMAPQKA
jgi:hypothetical protein